MPALCLKIWFNDTAPQSAALGIVAAADGVAGAVAVSEEGISAGQEGEEAGARATSTRSSIRGLLNRMAGVQIGSMIPGEPATEAAGENVGVRVQRAYVDPAKALRSLKPLFDIVTSSSVSFTVPPEASSDLAGAGDDEVFDGW